MSRAEPAARPRTAAELAPVFFALGDVTRLQLVALLCAGGALSIAQLTTHTELSRQAVTKHLRVMAEAGLVSDLRQGRERLWQYEPAAIDAARASLEAAGKRWEDALGRLKRLVET